MSTGPAESAAAATKAAKATQHVQRGVPRFYEHVTVGSSTDTSGWEVLLDNRALYTPGGKRCVLPTEAAAHLVASEWESQSARVLFEEMPISSLVIQTVDLVSHDVQNRRAVEAETLKFLATDCTVFVRPGDDASSQALRDAQLAAFRPIHGQLETYYSLPSRIQVSNTLQPPVQPRATRDILAGILTRKSVWGLSCLFCATRNLKSYLLGIALMDDLIQAGTAMDAASVEERFQVQRWGDVDGVHDVQRSIVAAWVQAAKRLDEATCSTTSVASPAP